MSNGKYAVADDFPLAEGFLASASATPGSPALYIDGKFYSYSELLHLAHTVMASIASSAGPVAQKRIAVHCRESAWSYASMLAVSMLGASYLPVSDRIPQVRMNKVLAQGCVTHIIAEQELGLDVATIVVGNSSPGQAAGSPPPEPVRQEEAYLLFTSGSTGEPKGVPVTKSNIRAFFRAFSQQFPFTAADRILQPFDMGFDVSVFCTCAAWNAGACAYVVTTRGFKPFEIVNLIRQYQLTVACIIPSTVSHLQRYLSQISFPSLRLTFFTADKLLEVDAQAWHVCAPQSAIYNLYGPTEATIFCTWYAWSPSGAEAGDTVPIGRALPGTTAVVLDESGEPAKEGELCICGPQVVPGYLHGNSSAFFFYNGSRAYRTGDLATVDENGDIHFRGRRDLQYKINGHRVESGEVERAVLNVSGIHSVVLAVGTPSARRLVCFSTSEISASHRSRLRGLLPDYMIPSEFVVVAEVPQGVNGKIDREALRKSYHERSVAG